jgi:assimilatory nitrate reductase catalytic subunit
MSEVKSTCPYCGVGCGVLIETREDSRGSEIVGVRGDPDHPANRGRLCSKGSTLHLTASREVQLQTRLLKPRLRADRASPLRDASWDVALDHVADRFAATIREHGPDSVAFYISGQLLTEDYYVFNKLAKGLIGTNNVDTNSRLCMSSAVTGYKATLGADAPPACYDDIDHTDCLLIAGSNAAWAHPVLFRRIEEAKARNPALKLIVVDPRRTATAECADLFIPILPGTDVALFNAMLHVMIWEDLIDTDYVAAHTSGFGVLKTAVRDCTPAWAARICGIDEEQVLTAARWFGEANAALSLYCQGLNQSSSGTAKNAALIHLHLATAQIGKPGAGPFSLTGQPNAMGGREVGGMANLLSAHRDLANAEHRAEVARLWNVADVPSTPGKTAVEMFDAIAEGSIKAVWIACTNPAQSMPHQKRVHEALAKAELVVVQDAYRTIATMHHADVMLPATPWGEKDGTVTNSERRISRQHAAVQAMGDARDDWRIAVDFARRLEQRLSPGQPTLFPYETVESVWNEHRESTRGRDLDITGLSYARLENEGPQQWPCRDGDGIAVERLYTDGIFPTADGRARFIDVKYKAAADVVDARFPLMLNTGRLRDQWHSMSRTGTVPRLFAHEPEPALEMEARDMARRHLADGDLAYVTSRRGTQLMPVRANPSMRSGQTYLPMHWGEEYLSGGAADNSGGHGVNALTSPAFDPVSKQPELKFAAIKVLRADLPWRFVAFAVMPADALHVRMQALRPLLKRVAFASFVPFGRDQTGMLLRAANDGAPDREIVDAIAEGFGLDTSDVLRYEDRRRGCSRRIRVHDGKLMAVALTGEVAAEVWLRAYLEAGRSVSTLGRLLLAPGGKAPDGFKARGRIVCNCIDVDEVSIGTAIGAAMASGLHGESLLPHLQQKLRCGTECGSCIPELRRMVAAGVSAA